MPLAAPSTVRAASRAARAVRTAQSTTSPEEEDSILRKAGNVGLSGLAAAGNFLDLATGASSVRDVMAGLRTGNWSKYNPFDQFMSPFSSENRATGRNVLEEYGAVGRNKVGKLDAGDVAGFGLEVLTDPAAIFGKGLTAAGRVAESAGLTRNIKAVAAAKLGKPVSARVARRAVSLGDLIQAGGSTARASAEEAAKRAGLNLNDLLHSSVGGKFSVGLPLTKKSVVGAVDDVRHAPVPTSIIDDVLGSVGASLKNSRIGQSKPVQKIGQAADWAKRNIRANLDYTAGGHVAAETQKHAPQLMEGLQASRQGNLETVLPIANRISKAGEATPAIAAQQRAMAEGVVPLAGDIGGDIQNVKNAIEAKYQLKKALGFKTERLDDVIDFTPRFLGADVAEAYGKRKGSGVSRAKPTVSSADVGREQWLKGYKQGTDLGPNTVVTDPQFEQIIDKWKNQPAGAAARQAFSNVSQVQPGMRVYAFDQKNFGKVVSVQGNSATVNFTNRAKGTSATVSLPISKLGPPGAGMTPKASAIKEIRDAIEQKYGQDIVPTYHRRAADGRMLFETPTRGTVAKSAAQIKKYGKQLPNGTIEYTTPSGFGKSATTEILTPKTADRYELIAKNIVKNPEMRKKGVFTNHWLADAHHAMDMADQQIHAANHAFKVLAEPNVIGPSRPAFRTGGETGMRLQDLFREMKLGKGAYQQLAQRMGINASPKAMRNLTVREDIAKELLDMWPGLTPPRTVKGWLKLYDSTTAAFKAGVLTWPARYVRDVMSGMYQNAAAGMFDGRSVIDAHKMLQGKQVTGLADLAPVKEWLQRNGRPIDDANAQQAVLEMFAALKGTRARVETEGFQAGIGGLDDLIDMIPGQKPALQPKQLARTFAGRTPETDLNLSHIRGVVDMQGNVQQKTRFGPTAAGDIVGRYTDDMNRLAPFLNQLRKGVEPAEAMRKIQAAQVNYSPETFTRLENDIVKRLLPFWSFSSRQAWWLANHMRDNPAGMIGQTLRANRHLSADDPSLPEHVSQTMSIPIGEKEDGTKSFIGGLGLMHEDPLQFLGGGAQGVLTEFGSRMNPIPKAVAEYAFDESLFQRTPFGGRDLGSMDPTGGRLVSNIKETLGFDPWEDASGRAKPIGGKATEFILANSPLSRALSTARAAFDPRKSVTDKALNLLTGVRQTDVSPRTQETTRRDKIAAFAKEQGARRYENYYFSKAQLEKMNEKDRALAEQLNAMMRRAQQLAKENAAISK